MKKILVAAAALGTMATVYSAPAVADDHASEAKWEVVETNSRGQATKVRSGSTTIDVCMNDSQDNCINPREAGLRWGNRPLAYWPGKPASRMD